MQSVRFSLAHCTCMYIVCTCTYRNEYNTLPKSATSYLCKCTYKPSYQPSAAFDREFLVLYINTSVQYRHTEFIDNISYLVEIACI